jgi:excinuclease ABC subunit C
VVRETHLEGDLEDVRRRLDLRKYPHRIECYDISHFQGEGTVASRVVFIDGKPDKQLYRHYHVKEVSGPDDFKSLREVLERRFLNDRAVPDLVLIDGGKGQLGAALEALAELGLGDQPVASLAKKEEVIFLPGRDLPVALERSSPVLQLVQRVRDEAHRFAIGFHRQARSKRTLRSELDEIPGVGPAKRRRLLSAFGSLRGVRGATEAELATVVGPVLAVRIRGHFEGGAGEEKRG